MDERRAGRAIFWLALLLALLWKVHALALPPFGEHAWRDADGLSVARGFLHESWNLFFPRVAERGARTGIVGMELPLVDWLAALSMRAFGESDFAARSVVWLSALPLAAGALALGRRLLRDELAARLAAALLLLQPLILVFSRKLMPEVPMLALLLWALVFAHDALAQPGEAGAGAASSPGAHALFSGVLFALAAVLKPTGAAAGVLVLLWIVRALRRPVGPPAAVLVLRALAIAALPLAAALAWFWWARALDARYGLPLFKLHHDWLEWTHLLASASFLSVVFGRIAHLYLLWPTVIVLLLRFRETTAAVRAHAEVALWALAALLLVVAFGSHNFNHSYYAVGLLPPLCLLAGDAVARIARALQRPALPSHALAAAFALIFAATALVRVEPRFPAPPFDAAALEAALPRLPQGLTVATDSATPVVSLVRLHRAGWALRPEELTPARLAGLRAEGAQVLVESTFGGALPEETRRTLPAPAYEDAQLRAYRLDAAQGAAQQGARR